MSTLNPTHIDVIAKHSLEFSEFYVEWRCRCEDPEARWSGAGISVRPLHAAHVVSKLTDAGYSIMPNVVLAELIDSDKCSFDHNGGCQAHGHFPPDDQAWTCPVEDAKNILAAATEEGQ